VHPRGFPAVLVICVLLGSGLPSHRCSAQVSLGIQATRTNVNLSLPASINDPLQGLVFPEYTVQRSSDLNFWEPIGGRLQAISGRSGPMLNVSLNRDAGPNFYRAVVSSSSSTTTTTETGDGGAEVFGYGTQFATELGLLDGMSVEVFSNNFPQPHYLPQIDWDPTTAQFWTNFNTDPAAWNANLGTNTAGRRMNDFRLDADELAIFQTNGFVVSGRLGGASFAQIYYEVFNDDLPVFVSTDSVMHAWHRTYENMLEELEEIELSTLLEQVITNMQAQLPQNYQAYGSGPLYNSFLDADFFLAVADSLWTGKQAPTALGIPGQDERVTLALESVASLSLRSLDLFGSLRVVDFSQFEVRGHYNDSVRLQHYFQTTMWCSLIDLRLATFYPNQEDDIRELGTALVLHQLLTEFGAWAGLDQITTAFVGTTDSMTFAQLDDLLAAANIRTLADVPDLATLTNLQTRLLTGELGVEDIRSGVVFSPLSSDQAKLPRSFTVSGQKFVVDSWAFSQMTYDSILWSPADGTNVAVFKGKTLRRKPSCLDVAFSIFGNDSVVPELAARMMETNGVIWRDDLPYQRNLTAVRNVIDSQDPGSWTNNTYMAWLGALRALSAPTVDPKYPEAMRTRAWAMKTLNTQLASWSELRHDTLLYAQQSYTSLTTCSYPAGFIEPRPEFWGQMNALATLTASAVAALPLSGTIVLPGSTVSYDLGVIKSAQLGCLTNFAATMLTLKQMAEEELTQRPFSPAEIAFLKNLIEETTLPYTGFHQYNGWYPRLFYRSNFGGDDFDLTQGSDKWDAMVADVQTDTPGDVITGDPGAVLHEAVGNVHLLMIAVDNGPDRMVYAGPVLSHYEFEEPGVTRLTDADWKTMVQSASQPPSPDWTQSYLVPASIMLPPGYY
jgi:hypothetical protein